MFAGFGFLWMKGWPRRQRLAGVVVGGLALAALTEIGQGHPIIRRDPDVFDALADMIGVLAGAWAGGRTDSG